jgi:hypothetical protein
MRPPFFLLFFVLSSPHQIPSQNHFAVGMVSRSCTPKPFYALNGFAVQLLETIPTAKWF